MPPGPGVNVLLNIQGRNSSALRNIAGVKAALATLEREQKHQVITTQAQARQTNQLNRLLYQQRKHLKGLTLDYVAVRRAVLSTGVRGAVTGFNALTGAVEGTALAAEGLVGSLGEASMALGAFGGQSLTALVQGLSVAKLALKGVNKALTANNPAQFARAMNQLNRPAQQFVLNAKAMRLEINKVQELTQRGMFPGLNKGFDHLNTQMDNIKQVAFDTAEMLGYLAEQAGKSIERNGVLYTRVAEENVRLIGRMGNTAIAGFEGVANVLDGAQRSTDILSTKILGLTRRWRDEMKRLHDDGTLDHFFLKSEHMAELWGGTTIDVLGAVFDHIRAGQPVIDKMTQSIHDAADRMHDWTSSEKGQKAMARNWEHMEPVMGELAKTVGAVGKALVTMGDDGAGNAVRMLKGFRTQILPVVHDLGNNLNDNVLPAFIDLVREGTHLAKAMTPGLRFMSQRFADIVGFGGEILGFVADLINSMPKATRVIGALVAGPVLLVGWKKFEHILEMALFRMRQLVGLAPKLASVATASASAVVSAPAAAVTAAGGRRSGQVPVTVSRPTRGVLRSPGSGGVLVPTGMGGSQYAYPGSGLRYDHRGNYDRPEYVKGSLTGLHTPLNMPRTVSGKMPRTGGIVTRLYPGDVRPGNFNFRTTPQQRKQGFPNRIDRSQYAYQQPMMMPMPGGKSDPEARKDFTKAKGGMPKGYRNPYSRLSTMKFGWGEATKGLSTSVAGGIQKGIAHTGNSAMLRGLMYGGVLSGVVAAFSSSELNKTLAQRTRNILSGLTFGAIKSAESQASDITSAASLGLDKGGKFTGARINDHRSLIEKHGIGFGSLSIGKKDAPDKFSANLSTVAGVKRFREVYLKALLDGKKITKDQFDQMQTAAAAVAEKIKGSKIKGKGLLIDKDHVTGPLGMMKTAFRTLRSDANLTMAQISKSVKTTGGVIKQNMAQGSDSAQAAMGKNFELAAKAVRRSMKASVISSKDGMAKINELLTKRLELYGLTPHQAKNYLRGGKGGKVSIYGGREEGNSGIGKARGGLLTVGGNPNAAGPDSVPMKIVAGRGEDVAVFNRHQRAELDQRLADQGGLHGFFSRKWPKHSAPGFARGGIVKLGHRLQRMGYAVSENPAFGGVTPGVHDPNGYHPKGQAIDVNADDWKIGEKAALDRLFKMLPGWHKIWQQKGHFDHMHIDTADGRGGLPGAVAKLPQVLSRIPGMLGDVVQGSLDMVQGAAAAMLNEAGGTGGGDVGGGVGKGGLNRKQLSALWRRAGGAPNMAALMGRIGMAESHGDRSAVGSATTAGHARGLWQIMWPLHAREFPGMDPFDPLDNAKMAVSILGSEGLGAWETYTNGAYQQFAAKGLLASASSGMPTQGGGYPTVNGNTDGKHYGTDGKIDDGKKKSTKKKSKHIDFTAPDLSRIRKAAKRKRKIKKVPRWIKKLSHLGDGVGDVPNFDSLYVTPIDDLVQKISNYTDVANLSDEQGILNDLTTGQEFVNWDGTTQDGTFIPGVNQHIAELQQLLYMHTGSGDGQGKAGLLGMMLGYGGALGDTIPKLTQRRDHWREKLAELHHVWQVAKEQRALDTEMISTLSSKGGSWQDRAATLGARIKAGQDALDELPATPLTAHGRNERKKLEVSLRRMRQQKSKLERDKPEPSSLTKDERAMLSSARGDRRDQEALLDAIGEGRGRWTPVAWQGNGTAAGSVSAKLTNIGAAIDDFGDRAKNLANVELPRERDVDIPTLISELNAWKGTHLSAKGASGDTTASDLEKQLLEDKLRGAMLANLQFGTLRDFAQNVGMRFLGSFAHGLTEVPHTGLALVHRNETIVPDQQGPFRTGATMARLGGGGQDGNLNVSLMIGFDDSGMLKIIDQRVEGAAAKVVSRTTGQRTRLIRAAG